MPSFMKKISLLGILLLQTPLLYAEELTIAVAANFTSTMNAIIRGFEAQTEHTVRLSSGSSGQIYAQIVNGAPFDIFFSADQEKPAVLENTHLSVPGSRFTYAIGTLVLWSKSEGLDLENGRILFSNRYRKLAIANPQLAPYGLAARQTLEYLGAYEAAEEKLVFGQNIAQTYQFIETGNADLGFVALSQILDDGDLASGSSWIVPAGFYSRINQDAILLRRAENNPAALDFLVFINSPVAAEIITQQGYGLP
jgi:molybdate transport system substrate-binding protein